MTHRSHRITRLALALAFACAPLGCTRDAKKPKTQVQAVEVSARQVPEPLQGTVGAVATSLAGEPILISGFGLVVGLNGTGGGLLDERVASTMEREMSLKGVGRPGAFEGTGLEDPVTRLPRSPAEVLRDPNVAVVAVQAVVPRGAPGGYQFDVYLQALNASSLEGGRLWTTDLRLGPVTTFGALQTRQIGVASGPVFINPFEDPASGESAGITSVGRVLAGGTVTNPLDIRLILDVPSHARARSVQHAINSRFPPGSRDKGPTARGRDDSILEVTIPWSYRDRPNEFLRIVEHLSLDQSFPQELARRYSAALTEYPELAEDLTWCLVALGDQALPFLRERYEEADPTVRMAALRAASLLGDPRAAHPLIDLADSRISSERNGAIALLGELDAGPTVDAKLRELVERGDLTTRTAAYEALARRAERAEYARLLAFEASRPVSSGMARTEEELRLISKVRLSGGTLQGVRRIPVAGKFLLDIVPFGEPLVYVSQQGTPRIVLFGSDLSIRRPVLASAWNDRLMLIADSPEEDPRLRYEDYRTGEVSTFSIRPDLPELIQTLARDEQPEDSRPALGLSYSGVVGALHALYRAGATPAAFATETDRLMAQLVEAARAGRVLERPETAKDLEDQELENLTVLDADYIRAERARKPQVVPLPPPVKRSR